MIRRRKRTRMGLRESGVIRCPSHLKWVRGCECAIAGKPSWLQRIINAVVEWFRGPEHVCEGKIEAHHVREGDHGQGMGQKPDDSSAVPLCSAAHQLGHTKGWKTFEAMYRVDLSALAEKLWAQSPHRKVWEQRENK
jgi:hypothetical protein